ncbi:MAG: hypothetical protein HND58_12185 [Planctomycetota bacterium]|nr:MAG: hypothetical protein HND58_12185 [Planctomycetota bacterium]
MSLDDAAPRAGAADHPQGALRGNDWNRQKTADDLGINRTTLYKKMRLLDIDPERDARLAG